MVARARYVANRQKIQAQNQAWRDANRDRFRATHRRAEKARLARIRESSYAGLLLRDPCAYCGAAAPSGTVDHITPRTRSGSDEWDNLTGACLSCNSAKHQRSLLTYLLRRLIQQDQGVLDEELMLAEGLSA